MNAFRATSLRRVAPLLAALVLAPSGLAMPSKVAAAAIFTVDSTMDGVDANPGDGRCLTASGNCTLRAAIQVAPSGSTINLPPGVYNLTILGPEIGADLSRGDLDIVGKALTIQGIGGVAEVRSGPDFQDRIFDVGGDSASEVLGASLQLVNVMITNGFAADDGGGIRNRGLLSLENTTLASNHADRGGGIYSTGNLTIHRSHLYWNNTYTGGAGGAGIYSAGGSVQISDSWIEGNVSLSGDGGGISIAPVVTSGDVLTFRISTSTISGNVARDGGAIAFLVTGPGSSLSPLSVLNSTISGNVANRNGGGIWTASVVNGNNDTIAFNKADDDRDGNGSGGGVFFSSGSMTFANSIIGANVDRSPVSQTPDCLGALTSNGFNLIQNTVGCAIQGVTTGNITGRDPRLAPLQDNGGPAPTHALLSTLSLTSSPSPAIEAGAPAATKFVQCLPTDERGFGRRDGNADGIVNCDIGAFELQTAITLLGTANVSPLDATTEVGRPTSYALTWTVPSGGWRQLDRIDLRFVDSDGRPALWLRFHEIAGAPGTFEVVETATGGGAAYPPGASKVLQSAAGSVDLAKATVTGPPGPSVTLGLDVVFKALAAGRSYDIEVQATSDAGVVEGFNRLGSVTVAAR